MESSALEIYVICQVLGRESNFLSLQYFLRHGYLGPENCEANLESAETGRLNAGFPAEISFEIWTAGGNHAHRQVIAVAQFLHRRIGDFAHPASARPVETGA